MRHPTRQHFVVLSEHEKYPVKEWLRENPEHIPNGMHLDRNTSWQLRYGLQRNGWTVQETDLDVHLVFPAENGENRVETSGASPDQHRRGSFAKNIRVVDRDRIKRKPFPHTERRTRSRNPMANRRRDIFEVSGDNGRKHSVNGFKLRCVGERASGQLMRDRNSAGETLASSRKVNGNFVREGVGKDAPERQIRAQKSAKSLTPPDMSSAKERLAGIKTAHGRIAPEHGRKDVPEQLVEVLQVAKSLIEPIGSWIQIAFARTASGKGTDIADPGATQFCLVGALRRAVFNLNVSNEVLLGAYKIVHEEIQAKSSDTRTPNPRNVNHESTLMSYNDVPGRTHREVLSILDDAIFQAEMNEFSQYLSEIEATVNRAVEYVSSHAPKQRHQDYRSECHPRRRHC